MNKLKLKRLIKDYTEARVALEMNGMRMPEEQWEVEEWYRLAKKKLNQYIKSL